MSLTEDVIRQITERVTREVVAALTDTQVSVEDEYPDWNEYLDEPTYIAALAGVLDVPDTPEQADTRNNPLRARLTQGIVEDVVIEDDDDDGPTVVTGDSPSTAVLPVGAVMESRRGGFVPDDAWINAQWARQPEHVRHPKQLPGWAVEQWNEVNV